MEAFAAEEGVEVGVGGWPFGGEGDGYRGGRSGVGAEEAAGLQGVAVGEEEQLVVGAGVGERQVWVVGDVQQVVGLEVGGREVGGLDVIGLEVVGWGVEVDGGDGYGCYVSGAECEVREVDFAFGGEALRVEAAEGGVGVEFMALGVDV